jgi:hypothetical protein
MTPRTFLASAIAVGVVGSGLLVASPANAADPMPRILLKGGAAEVSRTYTATASGRAFPAGSVQRYQWYRGAKDADPYSFDAIPGATSQRYKLKDADHMHTVKVLVTAYRNGNQVGQTDSAASNYVLLNMAPPVLHGSPHPGQVITATLGEWAKEWNTKLWWRRGGNNIAGQTHLTYRVRPADAGKEISILAIGDYHYANGVHPIDRYASRMRINWGTHGILRGVSKAPGKLGITAISYVKGGKQWQVRGKVSIYDGKRLLKRTWLRGGRKVFRFSGLASGNHKIKMLFANNPFYGGTTAYRTFHVR